MAAENSGAAREPAIRGRKVGGYVVERSLVLNAQRSCHGPTLQRQPTIREALISSSHPTSCVKRCPHLLTLPLLASLERTSSNPFGPSRYSDFTLTSVHLLTTLGYAETCAVIARLQRE